MKEIDFFSKDIFRESPRTDSLFGINDAIEEGEKEGRAYTTTSKEKKWNATVENKENKTVTFQPLDHNIEARDKNGNQYSLCDGMLFTEGYGEIIFVELKNRSKDWVKENIGQLKSTISLFVSNHDYQKWRKRTAYASNNRHPQFMCSHRTEMQDFYNRTHFFLRIVAKIII